MYKKKITKFLLITLILFPLIAGAEDVCKPDEVCEVLHEEGIFLGRKVGFPVASSHKVVDSTDSVVSAAGLSVSTTLGLTDIPANIKLEKSKPMELGSEFNKKDLPSINKHLHKTESSRLPAYQEGSAKASWIDKIFILLIGVLLVFIILIYLRKLIERHKL